MLEVVLVRVSLEKIVMDVRAVLIIVPLLVNDSPTLKVPSLDIPPELVSVDSTVLVNVPPELTLMLPSGLLLLIVSVPPTKPSPFVRAPSTVMSPVLVMVPVLVRVLLLKIVMEVSAVLIIVPLLPNDSSTLRSPALVIPPELVSVENSVLVKVPVELVVIVPGLLLLSVSVLALSVLSPFVRVPATVIAPVLVRVPMLVIPPELSITPVLVSVPASLERVPATLVVIVPLLVKFVEIHYLVIF